MMSLWDALRMNMMISYQELVRTFPKETSFWRAYGWAGDSKKATLALFVSISMLTTFPMPSKCTELTSDPIGNMLIITILEIVFACMICAKNGQSWESRRFPCLNDIHREAKIQSIVTGYWDKSHIQVKKIKLFSMFTDNTAM